jgi:adenosylmethionine-8-amino-7-oxononanoate aminotransferase
VTSVLYRDPRSTYPQAVSASGMYLYDDAGRAYLDMSGGAAVCSVGHGHAGVIAAIQAQAASLAFAHTAFFTNAPQEELARRISARFAESDARVFFTAGGSEANETALKLAWFYWQALGQKRKSLIVSRKYSYHGNTLGALSVSDSRARRAPLAGVLHDWPRIAPCYAYRHQHADETAEAYGLRAARELEGVIEASGPENVAAFIAEPVVGASLGVVPAVAGYFREIRRICDRYDVLLICDEIMCGSGRTGTFFAHETDGIVPDLVTLAKGIGSGYQPLGATLARQRVWEVIRDAPEALVHGHTYVGHALACAAGVAVQDAFDQGGMLARVDSAGELLFTALRESIGEHAHVGDIRGRGLFAGIEIVADRETREPFAAAQRVASRIKTAAMDAGLIIYPGSGSVDGVRGAHILVAPPFIAEQQHFDELGDKLQRVLADVFTRR